MVHRAVLGAGGFWNVELPSGSNLERWHEQRLHWKVLEDQGESLVALKAAESILFHGQ